MMCVHKKKTLKSAGALGKQESAEAIAISKANN